MIARTLGPLSNLHQMLVQVVESLADAELRRCPHHSLYPPGWYLGRAVYLETYWLRERLAGDDDLTRRVRHIFGKGACTPAAAVALLAPRDHLLNWALEIQDEHLTRLANPGLLPRTGLDLDWLASWLLQAESSIYEDLLLAMTALRLGTPAAGFAVENPLCPAVPRSPLSFAVRFVWSPLGNPMSITIGRQHGMAHGRRRAEREHPP